MRNLILLTVFTLTIFTLAACGDAANTTNNAANTATTNAEKPAENVLKPGDVNPDKPVAVKELVDGVFADKDAWKGKEVAVKGYVYSTSGSGGKFGYIMGLKNDQKASGGDSTLGCKVPTGDIPKDLLSKNVEVKGKISEMRDEGKNVRLDPCELVKTEGQ